MARSLSRSHVLVLPLVILTLILLEEVAEYQLRLHVQTVELRVLGIMACYAVGFTFAANKLSPWLKRAIVSIRSRSRRGGGRAGVWGFFVLAYGALFYAYLRLELFGPAGLLPAVTPGAP